MASGLTYEDIEKVNATLKTTDIKGKDYVEVNERIKAFRMLYPTGSIRTDILSNENGVVIMKAIVGYYTDSDFNILGMGTAYEKEDSSFINKTSYIENCETSAWGRALGNLGIGIDTSIATAEEVLTAAINQQEKKENKTSYNPKIVLFNKLKAKQLTNEEMNAFCKYHGIDGSNEASIQDFFRKGDTDKFIDEFKNMEVANAG